MRYWPLASMTCPAFGLRVAERETLAMRLPSMTMVESGWVAPVTVSMTVAWVMVRVCALAQGDRERTMRNFRRVRTD